ncbi:MAG: hypothetical protein FJY85_12895, partial [Deltaproteobacteria bacterium]|nr:hypothetical protein [Deltaproteobacteria bacterium]
MDRVIFDSRSYVEGVPFTGISGKYWDVLLGRGLLLDSFEKGFVGVSQGEQASFQFTFPDDYDHEELRGIEVEVQAKVHKVFALVQAGSIKDVRNLCIRNRYEFTELDTLRDQNEILYYLALRDTAPTSLVRMPSHFLMYVRMLAKLGKFEEVQGLTSLVAARPTALAAVADMLAGSGKCSWAVDYYDAVQDGVPAVVLKKARCLLRMGLTERAMHLLESIREAPDLEFQETLLACLKAARPDSRRIPSLEHHVMDLRVEATLQRESLPRTALFSAPPVVHGIEDQ